MVSGRWLNRSEQMLDRMQAMMSVPAELRARRSARRHADQRRVAARPPRKVLLATVKEKSRRWGLARAGGIEQETEASRCSPSWTGWPPDDQQFVPLMTKFAHAARAHISYEERRPGPASGPRFRQNRPPRFGEKTRPAATKAGPTRPHRTRHPSPASEAARPGRRAASPAALLPAGSAAQVPARGRTDRVRSRLTRARADARGIHVAAAADIWMPRRP